MSAAVTTSPSLAQAWQTARPESSQVIFFFFFSSTTVEVCVRGLRHSQSAHLQREEKTWRFPSRGAAPGVERCLVQLVSIHWSNGQSDD